MKHTPMSNPTLYKNQDKKLKIENSINELTNAKVKIDMAKAIDNSSLVLMSAKTEYIKLLKNYRENDLKRIVKTRLVLLQQELKEVA